MTEAAMDTARTPAVRLRVDGHRCREGMQTQLAGTALEKHTGGLHGQRWHGIGAGARRIKRACAGKTGYTDVPIHLRVVRFQLRIGDRPILERGPLDGAEAAALHEIDLVEAPVVRGEMRA